MSIAEPMPCAWRVTHSLTRSLTHSLTHSITHTLARFTLSTLELLTWGKHGGQRD